MRGDRLPNGLVVVERSNLATDELLGPYRERVGSSASSADVAEEPDREQRIERHPADTLVSASGGYRLSVVRTFDHAHVVAFPNVLVLIRTLSEIALSLAFK